MLLQEFELLGVVIMQTNDMGIHRTPNEVFIPSVRTADNLDPTIEPQESSGNVQLLMNYSNCQSVWYIESVLKLMLSSYTNL